VSSRSAIHASTLYKYLKCPSWLWYERTETADSHPLRLRVQLDQLAADLTLELILKLRPEALILPPSLTPEEREVQTKQAMADGVPYIVGPRLSSGRLVAEPDLLEKVSGKNVYFALDVRRSRRLKDEYIMAAQLYADVLQEYQGWRPAEGYVINRFGDINVTLLADTEIRYRLLLDSVERLLDGTPEPHFLTSDCKQSPWFHRCKEEAKSADHLSRLNRIWHSEVSELEAAGFKTVSDLAGVHPDLLAGKVSGIPAERLVYLSSQARALQSEKLIELGQIDVPSSPVSLVVDIESDPLRSAHYLFGVLVVDGDRQEFHSFLAKKPADEEAAWRGFVAFVEGYVGVPIYHYGSYEVDVIRELTQKYQTAQAFQVHFEEQAVDLLVRLREKFVFPLSFFSLKDIAQFIGFRWRHDDAGGLNSVVWYEDWLETDNIQFLTDILHYNEDDVRATWAVLDWALKR
jgi:predicted RecB family nuclease